MSMRIPHSALLPGKVLVRCHVRRSLRTRVTCRRMCVERLQGSSLVEQHTAWEVKSAIWFVPKGIKKVLGSAKPIRTYSLIFFLVLTEGLAPKNHEFLHGSQVHLNNG